MLQVNYVPAGVLPNRNQNTNMPPSGNENNDFLSQITFFKSFLKNMVHYFIGLVLTSAFVILTILLYLSYKLPNTVVYCSIVIWSCLNLMNFFLLHYNNLPRQRKMFEIIENFCIIVIVVIPTDFLKLYLFYLGLYQTQ